MESNLERFIKAQEQIYQIALEEIKKGKKTTHWIWFIFPQLKGLGHSEHSEYYGIFSIEEAKEYLSNEILSKRLMEITKALLRLDKRNISDIMDYIDSVKLKSSMTLFFLASNNLLFKEVLDKYFEGKLDNKTLELLERI